MSKIVDYDVITHPALNGMIGKVKVRIESNEGWEPFGPVFWKSILEREGKGLYLQAMVKRDVTTPFPASNK